MTFRRRSLSFLVGLATLGAIGSMPQVPEIAPSVIPSASRRAKTPRRIFGHQRGELPGRKGIAQKRQGKQCHHQKKARNRRRTSRIARR